MGMTAGQAKGLVQSFTDLDAWAQAYPEEKRYYRVERMPKDEHPLHNYRVWLLREGTGGSGYPSSTIAHATSYALSHDSMRGIDTTTTHQKED